MTTSPTLSSTSRPPWAFDPSLDDRFKQITYSESPYARIDGGKEDFEKVFKIYQERPIPGYDLEKVEIVFNPVFKSLFVNTMDLLEQRASSTVFASTWEKEKDSSIRKVVHHTLQVIANQFSSGHNTVKVIPMFHGTRKEAIDGILKTGYANLATTDSGFFGKGLYFTSYPEYAFKVYGDGTLLFNWVAIFSAYPVSPNDDLNGKSNMSNYDAHYALVKPKNPDNPDEKYFISIQDHEKPKYDELIVFDASHIFPQYIVTVTPNILHTLALTSKRILPSAPTKRVSESTTDNSTISRTINRLIADGEKELKSGNRAAALKIFNEILKSDPKHALSLFKRGEILASTGDYTRALVDLNLAAELSPQDPFVLAEIASTHLQVGNSELGLTYSNRALKIDPFLVLALKVRGIFYLIKKQFNLAVRDYDSIIKIQPNNSEVLSLRGQAYYSMKHYDQALRDLTKASQLSHGDAFILCRLGEVQLALKHYDSALQSFYQVKEREELYLAIDPSSTSEEVTGPNYKGALAGLGVCYKKKNEFKQALDYLNRVLKIDANMLPALVCRGEIYEEQAKKKDKLTAALQDFSRALEINPNHPPALIGRSNIFQKKKLWDDCIRDRKKGRDLKKITTLIRKGEDDFAKGEYNRAYHTFGRVQLMNPNHLLSKIYLGEICYLKKAYAHSLIYFTEALEIHPDHPTALSQIGYIHYLQKDFDQALQFLDRALNVNSIDALALSARSIIHYSKKNFTKALEDIDLCLKIHPANEKFLNFRANIHRLKGNYDQALPDLFKSLSIKQKSIQTLWIRGEVYYAKGNYEHALKDFTEVTLLDPTSPLGFTGLGKVYQSMRKIEEAEKNFKHARELATVQS